MAWLRAHGCMACLVALELLCACGRAGYDTESQTSDCTPGPGCFDVSGRFSSSDFAIDPDQLQIFGKVVANGEVAYGLLDGSDDDTATQIVEFCPYSNMDEPVWEAWDIERKRIDDDTYRLLVNGGSAADCPLGQPISAGTIEVNRDRGWEISSEAECYAMGDDASNGVVVQTWCDIDVANGLISWQAGSECGDCCACSDGAIVRIEVVVSR